MFQLLLIIFQIQSANAYRNEAIISNGNGISSPSYWNAVEGENPAGLALNSQTRFQLGGGRYATGRTYEVGGLFYGSRSFGVGAEYQLFQSPGQGKINSGFALNLDPMKTSLGLAFQYNTTSRTQLLNLGLLIEFSSQMRLGLMAYNFDASTRTLGAGLTYSVNSSVDLVVDADYNTTFRQGGIKPGLTLRSGGFQVSGAYGFYYEGISSVLVTDGFTGAVALDLSRNLTLTYQYEGISEHRGGLSFCF